MLSSLLSKCLPLMLLQLVSTACHAVPPCLKVLQPSGVTPLSKHAGEHGKGKTSVLLRYEPLQDGWSAAAPDLESLGVEWRLHIYTQHTSMSIPVDLRTTSLPSNKGDKTGFSWRASTEVEPGFRVGTHFMKASLLEFSKGCKPDSSGFHECDDVRHFEREESMAAEIPSRRLVCKTATRIFDVRLDTRQAMIQAKILKAVAENLAESQIRHHSRGMRMGRGGKPKRPLHIVFISSLTNDGQSTRLFQLLPRLLSDARSFRITLLHPKIAAESALQNKSNYVHYENLDNGSRTMHEDALDWSLNAASRFNNKRHLMPATDLKLFQRVQALMGKNLNSVLSPYEMRGWTVREFEDAGGLRGIVDRLHRVPTGKPERMAASDRRSLQTLMRGLRAADVVHYTHIPEQALENQLLVQSARIMGVQRIVCEPGRWHDDTLDDLDSTKHATSRQISGSGITDVIGPSAASCANWFSNRLNQTFHDVEVDSVDSIPLLSRERATARATCHVLPIGADVDINEIGLVRQRSVAKNLSYRVPFEELLDKPKGLHDPPMSRPTVVVAVIGRLAAIKSPGIIMRAAAMLQRDIDHRRNQGTKTNNIPRFVFEFWGDGPLIDLLAGSLASELGLSVKRHDVMESATEADRDDDVLVTFEGWISHEKIHSRLQSSVDAVLHSSFEETYCASNVEALAAGRVLFTFGAAGVTEYLQQGDGHGVYVWPPTPASLAAALWAMAEKPEIAGAVGRAAEEYVIAEGLLREATIDRVVQFFSPW